MEEFLKLIGEWYQDYGYPVLFFGVMLENAGIPVPGETAVLGPRGVESGPTKGGAFGVTPGLREMDLDQYDALVAYGGFAMRRSASLRPERWPTW